MNYMDNQLKTGRLHKLFRSYPESAGIGIFAVGIFRPHINRILKPMAWMNSVSGIWFFSKMSRPTIAGVFIRVGLVLA